MIVSLYIEEHQYLIDEPQTINLGGQYLYSFEAHDEILTISRIINDKFIPDFFNISKSDCKTTLLSAIVGQNGAGKSSILDIIRSVFIENQYSLPYCIATILVEVNEETKILHSPYKHIYLKGPNQNCYQLERAKKTHYQSIYYSPHFDLKYNNDFNEIDKYDISLDQYIKEDLSNTEKGTNENGFKFGLHEELLFKNSMRQIEFLDSFVYRDNRVFRDIFSLPQYNTGILHFRDLAIPDLWNTPNPLRPAIGVILEKLENENNDWHIFRDSQSHLDESTKQAKVNKYLLERFVIKAFISIVINQMEKRNTYLEEGKMDDYYNIERFKDNTAIEVLFYFVRESYIKGKENRPIFNHQEIVAFFGKLELLFSKEINPNNITKQSIRLSLNEMNEILDLHKKIVTNLFYYFPISEGGLIEKSNYTDGFLSFRPTDKSLSSGENALLNLFSRLYNFIQGNLIVDSQFLPIHKNYIILLDEADLGFHPVWKKRYIDAILSSLPHFFESLDFKPNLQIIITTHDPLTLSDLPINNVVFLTKDRGHSIVISDTQTSKIQRTFGANIADLLSHSFFVDDGLIGDFSKSKIKEVISWINNNKNLEGTRKNTSPFKDKFEYYKKVINLIDERVVKMKLLEMITEMVPDNEFYNQTIDAEIEFLRRKKK